MKHRFWVLSAVAALAISLTAPSHSQADGPPPRDLATPEARKLSGNDDSEYWDLTAELEQGYWVMARFQITNEGPGDQNGTAVGHVISPDGEKTQFRNGRLKSGWTLSQDGLDLDIGRSHLDLHGPKYKLKVNKPDARVRLSFSPNALYRLPKSVTGKGYEVDLLALGATASGSVQLEGMPEPVLLSGRATLTHTVSKRSETDLNLRRTELFYQPGAQPGAPASSDPSSQPAGQPLYITTFLHPRGMRTQWLATLEPGCDPSLLAAPAGPPAGDPEGPAETATKAPESRCVREITTTNEFDLVAGDAKNRPSKRDSSDSYWIPPGFDIKGKGVEGRVQLEERILRHDPLDDLPGPIRFLAGLSTKPRRVWSTAEFEVRLPPSLNSKPILFQGQGVATVSFLNPVTRP